MCLQLTHCRVVGLTGNRAKESIDDGAGLFTHARNRTTDNGLVTSPLRFPDLTGKAVIVIADSELLAGLVGELATNGMLIAAVAADRELVHRAIGAAEALGAMVNGFTVDPGDPAVWERIRPHIEQRLGPIDVAICAETATVREVVRAALLPDMLARNRGVIIEIDQAVGPAVELGNGVRHHTVEASLPAAELVGTVVALASDTATPGAAS